MDSYGWLIFLSLGYFIISLAILITAGVLVYFLMELKRAAAAFQETLKNVDNSIKNIEENMKPVLEDAGQALKSIRSVSEDVEAVTGNVRNFSAAMYDIAINLRAISSIINDLRGGASLRATGLKVGVKTALNVLVKELTKRQ
jgi:uncharacterized protein YoxC